MISNVFQTWNGKSYGNKQKSLSSHRFIQLKISSALQQDEPLNTHSWLQQKCFNEIFSRFTLLYEKCDDNARCGGSAQWFCKWHRSYITYIPKYETCCLDTDGGNLQHLSWCHHVAHKTRLHLQKFSLKQFL